MPTFGSHVIPGSITREIGLIEIWLERKNLVLLGGSGLISSFSDSAYTWLEAGCQSVRGRSQDKGDISWLPSQFLLCYSP
jgi:hypothetical protein